MCSSDLMILSVGLSVRNRTRTAAGVPARALRATSPNPFGFQDKSFTVALYTEVKSRSVVSQAERASKGFRAVCSVKDWSMAAVTTDSP